MAKSQLQAVNVELVYVFVYVVRVIIGVWVDCRGCPPSCPALPPSFVYVFHRLSYLFHLLKSYLSLKLILTIE